MQTVALAVIALSVIFALAIFIVLIRAFLNRDYGELEPLLEEGTESTSIVVDYPRKKVQVDLTVILRDKHIRKIRESEIEVKERVGSGAYASVYEGFLVPDGIKIAIKKSPYPIEQMKVKELANCAKEIKLLSAMVHPNILQILGVSISQQHELFLVLELMEAGTLLDVMKNKDLSQKEKVELCLQAANGLNFLHEQDPPIIHRDIKPSNILVNAQGVVKIADFGISTLKVTRTMTCTGTPVYMAPEVIRRQRYTEMADVYSFGILLNEVMNGVVPYSDQFLSKSFDKVMYAIANKGARPTLAPCSPVIQNLIQRCWSAECGDRPMFREIVEQLESFIEDGPDC